MIYCPHCRRPSARERGACPHCGKSLTGSDAPGPPQAPGRASGAGQRIGGAEFELDDDGSSGELELAGDDYMAPQTAEVQGIPGLAGDDPGLDPGPGDDSSLSLVDVTEPPAGAPVRRHAAAVGDIDDEEVRAVAGFGSPSPGPIGAIRYGLRVNARLKELAAERDRAVEGEKSAVDRLREARAELGRKAGQSGASDEEIESLMSKAQRADAELSGAENRQAGIASEQQGKLHEVEQAIARLEAVSAPIKAQEAEAFKRLEALRTDRKRVEAKLKRAEIERRNLSELVEKRQQAYADLEKPQEERQQLLADITRFENDLAPINERIEQARAEQETFDKPLADAESALTALRGRVSEKLAQISALRDEADQLQRQFNSVMGNAAATVQEEGRRAEEAWAAVGERVFADLSPTGAGSLAEKRERVAAALERWDDTKRKVDLLTRARDSYDHGAVKQAKQIAIVGGIIVFALLLTAIVLIASG